MARRRGPRLPTCRTYSVPVFTAIPVLGPAFFQQPVPTYLVVAALPLVWWVLFRTRAGARVRATGEAAAMARATGVRTG